MSGEQARERLQNWLRQDRDGILDLVQRMVRIPSENPPGDTTELFAFVGDYLEERGLGFETIAPQPHLPNLVAGFDGGQPGRHLVLNGHLDVFPAGDQRFWSDDPFSGTVRDSKLFGRGVTDMKVGTAASILTYCYLSRMRDHLKGRLTLSAVSDEETGGVWGTGYLMEHCPDVLGDCVLNGEPSTAGTVRFGEKGPTWLRMEVTTPGGHGAYDHLSANAIVETAAIISELRELANLPVAIPADVEQAIEAARESLDAALGAGATDVAKRVSAGFGVIEGGVKVNVIASECRTEVDLRCPVGLTAADLIEAFENILARHPNASYMVDHSTDPTWCDPNHEMVGLIQKNSEAVRGIRPLPGISLGGTDCRFWRQRGIPAYVYGPTPNNMGAPDEFVTLDDLFGTVHVHVLSAFDYLTAET